MLDIESKNGVVWLTLNRPPANALSNELLRRLVGSLEQFTTDTSIRGVVLTGAGDKFFCAGGDVKEFSEIDVAAGRERVELGSRLKAAMGDMYCPVVVAVNGAAIGSGMEMASFADFCVASTTARFGMPEINHGLLPMAKGIQQLVKVIGLSRTKDVLFHGDIFDVEKAHEYGLVHEVVDPDALLQRADEWISDMAAKPPQLFRALKRAVVLSQHLSDAELQALTDADIVEYFGNGESQKGLEEFVNRPTPTGTH